jgi:DNA-binding FadR family transcriptional regulator
MFEFKLNYVSSISFAEQLQFFFIKAIERGQLSPGQKLPTATTLSRKLKMPLWVAREAYKCLLNDGLIERTDGQSFLLK